MKETVSGRRSSRSFSRVHAVFYRLIRNPGAVIGLTVIIMMLLLALLSPFLFDYESEITGILIAEKLQPPSPAHWFGTDDLGRDILKRLIYGSRYSFGVGFVSMLLSLGVGVVLGALAGYYSGPAEEVIMRLIDILSAVPAILFGVLIAASLGASTGNLILATGISGIPQFVRITRASVLAARSQDYVEVLRSSNLSEGRILALHILPNSLSPILVQATLRIGSAIIAISSLSFLGMGIPVPAPEWGNMLNQGRQYVRTAPYISLFPGLAILAVVLAFNLLGDGLRDALDPRLRY